MPDLKDDKIHVEVPGSAPSFHYALVQVQVHTSTATIFWTPYRLDNNPAQDTLFRRRIAKLRLLEKVRAWWGEHLDDLPPRSQLRWHGEGAVGEARYVPIALAPELRDLIVASFEEAVDDGLPVPSESRMDLPLEDPNPCFREPEEPSQSV